MLLKTILNRVAPQTSFVYGETTFATVEGRLALEVQVQPRRNSRPICSGSQELGSSAEFVGERYGLEGREVVHRARPRVREGL